MATPTDEQLIQKYRSGDRASFNILVQRHFKHIYSFSYRFIGNKHDAEDITQDTFVKAWKHLKKFDTNKNFKTWLFSIAKNTCLDFLKKKKPILFSNYSEETDKTSLIEKIADIAPLPQKILEQRDLAHVLSLAISKLTPSYQTVLFLRYNDHFTFKEIAESLEEPLHTVKSRHRRALIQLKKLLCTKIDR